MFNGFIINFPQGLGSHPCQLGTLLSAMVEKNNVEIEPCTNEGMVQFLCINSGKSYYYCLRCFKEKVHTEIELLSCK